jgi:hypothetical protein
MVPIPGVVSLAHLALASAGQMAEHVAQGRQADEASQGPTGAVPTAGESAPKALRLVLENAPLAFAVVVAMVVTVAVLSRWRSRKALANRVVFVALPTESFDPSPEEIVRFAGLLLRCRRGTRGFSSRRTDSVRLRLSSLPGGRLIQSVEGPRRAESVLRMGGFAEVDLRSPETIDLEALSAIATTGALDEDDDKDKDDRDRRRGEHGQDAATDDEEPAPVAL